MMGHCLLNAKHATGCWRHAFATQGTVLLCLPAKACCNQQSSISTPCIVPTLCSNDNLLIPVSDTSCLLGLMQTTHGCGDLIFSSHTTFALVGVLTYTEYGAVVITKVHGLLNMCAFKICCITSHAAFPTVQLHFGGSC